MRRPLVFLSHSKSDAATVERVSRELEQAKIRTWFDSDSIKPGEGWVESLNHGLEQCTHFVLFLTPRAVERQWVRQEVSVAIARERQGLLQIIPLLIEPCDVPPLWGSYQAIRFDQSFEAGMQKLVEALKSRRGSNQSKTERRSAKRPSVFPKGGPLDAELDATARLYDSLQPRLPDSARNLVLNLVFVDRIFLLGAAQLFSHGSLQALFERGSDGDRLIALLGAQTNPSTESLGSALNALREPRSPFEQFQALRTISLTLHRLNRSQRTQVRRALAEARRQYLVPENASRWEIYEEIRERLDVDASR